MIDQKIFEINEELRARLKEELRQELLNEEKGCEERDENEYPWIIFALNNTEYAINSKYVLSIEILGKVTPIIDAQHYCPGITDSRGDIIELLDLRALFGLGSYQTFSGGDDERTMTIVIEIDEIKRGMIADAIVSVEHITTFVEGVVNENDGSISSQYIRQIAMREKLDSPVLIINYESLSKL